MTFLVAALQSVAATGAAATYGAAAVAGAAAVHEAAKEKKPTYYHDKHGNRHIRY